MFFLIYINSYYPVKHQGPLQQQMPATIIYDDDDDIQSMEEMEFLEETEAAAETEAGRATNSNSQPKPKPKRVKRVDPVRNSIHVP